MKIDILKNELKNHVADFVRTEAKEAQGVLDEGNGLVQVP